VAATRLRYITLFKIFRLERKPKSYKYWQLNIKTEQRRSVCVYNTHIRAGVGNDMLQISEMVDSSRRVISSSQRPLPDNTQHSQQTNVQAPRGIRIHNLSRRAAADLRLRPRVHWDRHCVP